MENRRVLFNGLRLNTLHCLNSLSTPNGKYTVTEIRDLFHSTHDISDEELERIEKLEQLWELLVEKEAISINNVTVLRTLARSLKSKELMKEVEDYEQEISELALKVGLPIGIGLAVLRYFGADETARQIVLEKIILPPLVKLAEVCEGSVRFVVETRSLSSLRQLWTSYKDGSLREKLKKVINEIQEVRELIDGTEIDVTVEIDEDEYREACWLLVSSQITEQVEVEQKTSGSDVMRPRRHSSCELDIPARTKPHLTWQERTILKEAHDRLTIETRRRKDAEKQVEKLTKELKLLKPVDTVKSKEEDIITLEGKNQDIISELGPSYSTDPKLLVKLQEAIQNQENRLKVAEDTGDMIGEGIACRDIGTIYCVLGKNYKKTYDEVKCREAMKKAESYLKQAVDCWERFSSQLFNEDKLTYSLFDALFVIYKLLKAVLIDTQKVEKAPLLHV